MTKKIKILLVLIIGTVIIIPTIYSLLGSGFFTVHDNTQVERIFQMSKALGDGNFPVRWVQDLGYGYGYPIFNFYAPLPYYLGGFLDLAIGNSILSTKIVFFIGIIFSFISMYLFASSLTSRLGGLAAGVIYLYFPYHAINIYIRGAVGEFYAYAFFPFVFWGIHLLFKRANAGKKNSIILPFLFSLPLFLVIISHNLSAYMLVTFLLPYIVFLFFKVKNKKPFIYSLFLLFGMSFLLSSFYILPAIFESQYTNVNSQIGGGADYKDHFVCPSQLWESNWGFGGSTSGCVDGLSFGLGKINILLLSIALIYNLYFYIKNKKITHEIIYWTLLLLAVFLVLPYSKFAWDIFPFMEYLQFPWRFLNFIAFFISVIVAYLVFKMGKYRIALFFTFMLVMITIYLNYKLFVPVDNVYDKNEDYRNVEHIMWETSKISDEYMPPNFLKPKSEKEIPRKVIATNDRNIDISEIKFETGYLEFVKNGNAGEVMLNIAYFPSWKAEIDGESSELIESSMGMNLLFPKGEHKAVVYFGNTIVQTISNWLSLIGVIVFLAVIIVKRKI